MFGIGLVSPGRRDRLEGTIQVCCVPAAKSIAEARPLKSPASMAAVGVGGLRVGGVPNDLWLPGSWRRRRALSFFDRPAGEGAEAGGRSVSVWWLNQSVAFRSLLRIDQKAPAVANWFRARSWWRWRPRAGKAELRARSCCDDLELLGGRRSEFGRRAEVSRS